MVDRLHMASSFTCRFSPQSELVRVLCLTASLTADELPNQGPCDMVNSCSSGTATLCSTGNAMVSFHAVHAASVQVQLRTVQHFSLK